jgi:dihydroorotase-like cyclic amidohydrolase
LLLDAALRRRISLQRLVEIYAIGPARRYRLAGKGGI